MKKILLSVLAMFVMATPALSALPAYANAQEADSASEKLGLPAKDRTLTDVATDTLEGAGAQLVTTANDILKATSEAFPELAGKSFAFYAQYVFAKGASQVVFGVLWIVLGIIAVFFIPKMYSVWQKAVSQPHYNDGEQIVTFLGMASLFATSVLGVVAGFSYLTNGIVPMIAPEGAVINEIIRNLR